RLPPEEQAVLQAELLIVGVLFARCHYTGYLHLPRGHWRALHQLYGRLQKTQALGRVAMPQLSGFELLTP
ncbi:MAG: hypothetical protein GWN58_07220, partial [Anaerolineae bacterium]|nr:hypothetical protein [Anaerolineae bacterium]